jgi:hypothetical protein
MCIAELPSYATMFCEQKQRVEMLKLKELNVQYITNEAGERSSVIMSIEDFEALLEDLEDMIIVVERRHEPTISHEELKAELKRDGLLPV